MSALTITPAHLPETPAREESITEVLEGTRSLVETTQATLEGLEGAAKNEVAKALAALLNAVAKRIEA
jgi:hypothetical protein